MSDRASNSDQKPSLAELVAAQTPAQLQKLTRTLALANIEAQGLLADIFGRSQLLMPSSENDIAGSANAFAALGSSLAMQPERLFAANMKLLQGWMGLMSGISAGPVTESDKRFTDPEWTHNPAFRFIRQAYALNTDWLLSLAEAAGTMDDATRRNLRFSLQQTADALAPSNFLATNPEALRAFIESGGETILDGLRQARRDIQASEGVLRFGPDDQTPFELGKTIANTPGKVIFRNRLIELIQYAPKTDTTYQKPLLIFPPWINKFYILDLREKNSMIRWLVDKGLTVLVISWRSACDETRDMRWDDYVREGVFAAIEATLAATGTKQLNAVGYCIGGTLLSSAMAYMAQHGDKRIGAATLLASQTDFELAGDLLVFASEEARANIDKIISDNHGVMPGEVMFDTFNWLRPVDLVWRYVVDQYLLGKTPRPFDLLYWNADQTNIPGPVHRTYLRDMYANNALARSNFRVLGKPVTLSDIKLPIMVQASREDHICPAQSVYRTAQHFGGKTQFILAGSGHIAGVVNHPAAKKYQHWTRQDLGEDLADWMQGAAEHDGSWWPHWWTWLRPKSGKKVAARKPKAKRGLPNAPGDYARIRLEDIELS